MGRGGQKSLTFESVHILWMTAMIDPRLLIKQERSNIGPAEKKQ